jgi:hypothetical protein
VSCKRIGTNFSAIGPPAFEGHEDILFVVEDGMGRLMRCRESLAIDVFTIIDQNAGSRGGVLHIDT